MPRKLFTAVFAVLLVAACDTPAPSLTPASRAPATAVLARALVAPPMPAPAAAKVAFATGPVVVTDGGVDDDELALRHDAPSLDHLARARQLRGEGDARGAFAEARRALFSAPEDAETLVLVAQLAQRVGALPMAAQAWGRLGALAPDDAAPLVAQARALYAAKEYFGARLAARGALDRDDGAAEAHHVIGLSQLATDELTAAIASFRRTLELSPDHGWAMNNLGLAYLRANENRRAIEVLEPATALLPSVAYVHNNLGIALERVGRAEEARAAYLHAMDLSPKYVKARVNVERLAKVSLGEALLDEALLDEALLDEALAPALPHPLPE